MLADFPELARKVTLNAAGAYLSASIKKIGWPRLAAVLISLCGLSLGVIARFFARPGSPLWMDETFSGVVASAPSLTTYFRLIGSDVNAPLYYLLLRPWSSLFGLSDGGLRSLSFVFSAAAPLAVALAALRGVSRAERLVWAAMVALWIPAIGYAQAAKPLALAYFLATLQALAFANLIRQRRSSICSAALWVGISALAIEAHYDDAYVALAQGLIYVALRRGAAVRTWPAVLLLVPVFIEVGRKASILAQFTTPGIAWYALVQPGHLPFIASYLLGGPIWLFAYPALFAAFWYLARDAEPAEGNDALRALALTAVASLLAAVVFVGVGAIRPTFNVRYLGPFAPGTLLGAILVLRWIARGERWVAFSALVVVASIFAASWLAIGAPRPDSGLDPLNFEQASGSLMRAGVRRVAFAWDNPGMRYPDEDAKLLGGFFFRRAGMPIAVTPVHIGPNDDPNQLFLQAAAPEHGAILWIYDADVAGTGAVRHPPRISVLNRNYECRNFGEARIGVVACVDKRLARRSLQ